MFKKAFNIFIIAALAFAVYSLAGGDVGAAIELVINKITGAVVWVGTWIANLDLFQQAMAT